jgi:tRNA pseudouridine13 synthase
MSAFKIKFKPEDFEVDEISLMPDFKLSGKGRYTYLWLAKRGLTTFEAQEKIKEHFNLLYKDINCEGLKDEDAVTRQIMSIKKRISTNQVDIFNQEHSHGQKNLKIEKIFGYGQNPVEERSLHGNCFRIVLRNLRKTTATKLVDFCNANRFINLVNYYDNQRFGMPGGPYNSHLIGKSIARGDWRNAFAEYARSHNSDRSGTMNTKSECRRFFLEMNPKRLNFFLSSYNSSIWNQAASKTLNESAPGKKHNFDHIGSLFIPSKVNFSSPALVSIPGYAMQLKTVRKNTFTRSLIITTVIFPKKESADKYHRGKYAVTLSFFLPTGSYATMVIKQLFAKIEP